MAASLRDRSAPALRWWVQRNPAYVLSAACIACGSRMLLVPAVKPAAGDLGLILLTLGVLQAYEAGVTAIMLFLNRTRRAPEDQPSLFIIAAVFWTGPLIATMELTALDPALGFLMALAAALIAFGELQALARYFHWRLSAAAQAIAAGCVLLVAAAQPLLHVADAAAGTNETLLYGLCWVVAGLLLAAIPGLRKAQRIGVEVGVIAAAGGAALLHLAAMNHAFFGHAGLFYAAAPLAAAAATGMLVLPADQNARRGGLIVLFFWLPALGIYLSCDRFDAAVPLAALPLPLRDPLTTGLTLAAGAWWCGFARHRWSPLLHAAVLATAFAVERFLYSGLLSGEMSLAPLSLESLTAEHRGVMLLTVACYLGALAWQRRSRDALVVALVLNQFGIAALIPWSWPSAEFIICVTWGWTALLVMHAAVPRPRLRTRLLAIALLAVATAIASSKSEIATYAKLHAVFLVVALAAAGWAMPWTRYRTVAVVIAFLEATPFVGHWIKHTPNGPAYAVIGAGFLLLAGGAAVSMYKHLLLARLPIGAGLEDAPGGADP